MRNRKLLCPLHHAEPGKSLPGPPPAPENCSPSQVTQHAEGTIFCWVPFCLSWDGAAQHSLSHGKACPDPDQHVTKKKTSAFLAQCQRPHGKVPNLIFKHSEFGRHSCVIILSILWADHSTWKAKRSHEWAQSRRGTWFKLDLLFHSMIMIDMQSHQTTFQGVCVCSVLSHSHELWHDQIEFRATPHSTLSQI